MNAFVFGYAVIAIMIAQISNVVMVKFYNDFFKLMQIVTIFQLIIGFFLIKYFSLGAKYQIKYAILALFYYGLSIFLSLLIQYFFFKKPLNSMELISIFLIISGIAVYMASKFTA